MVEKFPDLRPTITEKLISTFPDIKAGKVYRGAMWIVGEYCETAIGEFLARVCVGAQRNSEAHVVDIKRAMQEFRKVLGEVPILASEQVSRLAIGIARVHSRRFGGQPTDLQRLLDEAEAADASVEEKKDDAPKAVTKTRVLADGTYATETTYTSVADTARLEAVRAASKPPLRALILGGDFYTGSVLASTLTKLVLRFAALGDVDQAALNQLRAEALLIMTSIIRVGQSKFVAVPIDEDSQERIMNCVETLAGLEKSKAMNEVFLSDTKKAYTRMIKTAEVSTDTLWTGRV